MTILSPLFRRKVDIFRSNTARFGAGFQTFHFYDDVIDRAVLPLQVAPLTAIYVQSGKGYIVR